MRNIWNIFKGFAVFIGVFASLATLILFNDQYKIFDESSCVFLSWNKPVHLIPILLGFSLICYLIYRLLLTNPVKIRIDSNKLIWHTSVSPANLKIAELKIVFIISSSKNVKVDIPKIWNTTFDKDVFDWDTGRIQVDSKSDWSSPLELKVNDLATIEYIVKITIKDHDLFLKKLRSMDWYQVIFTVKTVSSKRNIERKIKVEDTFYYFKKEVLDRWQHAQQYRYLCIYHGIIKNA